MLAASRLRAGEVLSRVESSCCRRLYMYTYSHTYEYRALAAHINIMLQSHASTSCYSYLSQRPGSWKTLQITHKHAQAEQSVIPVSSQEARLASGSTAPTKQSTPFSAASAFSLQHRQKADGQAAMKGNLGDIVCWSIVSTAFVRSSMPVRPVASLVLGEVQAPMF